MLKAVDAQWNGRWVAFDLPGHGGSDDLPGYSNEDYASSLGPAICEIANGLPVTLVGHSLGGTITLVLASGRFGFIPDRAFAIGIKVHWSDEELQRFGELSRRDPKIFATEGDALAMHARYCGLPPDTESGLLASGTRSVADGWRAALDLRAFAVVPPDMPRLVEEAQCPVHLACGDADAMVSLGDMQRFDPMAVDIAGAGHNAMVDAPQAVWSWISSRR